MPTRLNSHAPPPYRVVLMGMRSPIFQPKRFAVLAPATMWVGCDGNAVADFPAKTLRGFSPRDGALAVLKEIRPLVIRDDQFRKNLPLAFWIDHKLREKIILVLVDSTEPVVMGDVCHARYALYFGLIRQRNQINDGGAVDRDQPVGAGQFCVAQKRSANNGEKGEQEQRHGERTNRQKQPYLLPFQIRPDQSAEFHATPPAIAFCGIFSPSTSTPFSRCNVV